MSNVIPLGKVTHLDLSPDQVLHGAMGELSALVIMAWDKDGDLYFASTMSDGGEVLWLMEQCKKRLLESAKEEEKR
ncbi:MAG: hypothetical protein KAY22_26525 [Rhizorhabdus sp.]|uniref:hypothetical protein n=1 Tax=Rhizorhabdus sp. TaxID=1968843 RepID=UPI001B46E921|nr:hypothetical protein [Rhizorhabdus sp.]MBP8235855.1 hypothetical protein [Rhizorhabdus sp.]